MKMEEAIEGGRSRARWRDLSVYRFWFSQGRSRAELSISGVVCLNMVVDNLDHHSEGNAQLFWLDGVLRRDLRVAFDWFDAALEASHEAAEDASPCVV